MRKLRLILAYLLIPVRKALLWRAQRITMRAGDLADELAPLLCSHAPPVPHCYDICFTMLVSVLADHKGRGTGFRVTGKQVRLTDIKAFREAVAKASEKYGRLY